ncbi:hypothetical protein [Aureispira anguillae]|uniref:Uncharacterized protein n=1 Tax=Aureispira anguillae TaxID=2864201 RepID=A0A916DT84_9BACT|nr:hypothetical protein [Aureispira anguillae]BDS11577.1 hypothetical protein AsAng_0022910 [Aureispira anguillae]
MTELSPEYFKLVAEQLVLISVFLGGISTTILGTIIMHESDDKILKFMILGLSLAAVSFIVSVIGMNKVLMVLAPDSPYQNKNELLFYPRLIGGLSFYLGIYSLLFVIGLTGWMKSKKIGIFTTTIGILSAYLIFILT